MTPPCPPAIALPRSVDPGQGGRSVIGWTFVCDLACSLLFGPLVASWMGGIHPVAPVTADCKCKVCECKDKCKCSADDRPAAARTGASSSCPDMAYCPGQHGGRPFAATRACHFEYPPQAATPAIAETVYQVRVRLTGEWSGQKGAVACPTLSLPANTYSLVSMAGEEPKATRAIHVHVQPVDDQTVRLNLKLSMPAKSGQKTQRLACNRDVRLD